MDITKSNSKPTYGELEARVHQLEALVREQHLLKLELMENQQELKRQNINLVRKSIELSETKRQLEDKNYELENARVELRRQNVQLVRKSIELSDIMRQLEDKNFDLESTQLDLQSTLKELTASKRRYRRFIDASVSGIGIIQDGEIVFCNRMYAEIFGFESADAVLGSKLLDLVAPESRSLVRDMQRRRLSGIEETTRYECKGIKRDGTFIDLEVLGSSTQYMGRTALLGTIIDITRRKKSEEERKRLEEQLSQALKMEAIGTLAGGIAHDFNNILVVIMGYAEMLMMNTPEDHKAWFQLSQIMASAERAKELVRRILAFSRKSEKRLQPVNVGKTIREALPLLRSSLPATIVINNSIEDDIKDVLADETQIHQIIMNLGSNAAHAMQEKGGTLDVNVRQITIDSDDYHLEGGTKLQRGDYVQLTVRDTGHGMERDVMDRIFEPYFTTKKMGEGTGMGLAMIHGIIKSYNGEIYVSSTPGKGTTFNLFFPIQENIKVRARSSRKPVKLMMGNERVLFVDDEDNIVQMSKQLLENLGYRVTAITGSLEALEYFRRHPDDFDIIITDQTMPYMTGRQLAAACREVKPKIPIILCSGYYDGLFDEQGVDENINGFVMKPFVVKELTSTIRKLIPPADK